MAYKLTFARGFVGVAALLTAITGCSSTGSNPGAADGAAMTDSASACIAAGGFCASGDVSCTNVGPQDCGFSGGFCCLPNLPDAATACNDASVQLIQASDYDQSCTVDTDCRLIAVGNACVPCAFDCAFGAAINASALPKYMSDVANTPAVAAEFKGQTCASGCPAAYGPCCVGGKCQASTTSQCPAAAADAGDAAADTGVDAAAADTGTDAATDSGPLDAGGG